MEINSILIEQLRSSKRLLNKNQLAAVLGISPITLNTRIAKGEVPEGERRLGKIMWKSDKVADHLEGAAKSDDRELTRRQVARYFGVADVTISAWLKSGKFVKPDRVGAGGRMFWKFSTVRRWEDEQTEGYSVGDTH